MKKLFSIMLSMLLFLGNITLISAEVTTKTIYVMLRAKSTTEDNPMTFYFGTADFVHPWLEDTYEEKMVIETDYLGNPITADQPAIVKVTIPNTYTRVGFSGGEHTTEGIEVVDGGVYAYFYGLQLTDYTLEDLDDITLMDSAVMPDDTVIPEGTNAYILGNINNSFVNKGTILYADLEYAFINEGTILDGKYYYVTNKGMILNGTYGSVVNEGTIQNGVFTNNVKNKGTILDGDFSAPDTLIYFISGNISDKVLEQCKVIQPCPVTFYLDKLTHDDETMMTIPGDYYEVNLTAEEGYVVPEEITVTIGGELAGQYDYSYTVLSATEATIVIYENKQTSSIEISASALKFEKANIENLRIGDISVVKNGYLRNASGENWSYDNDTNTLTFDNFTIVDRESTEPTIECSDDLNLVLKGTNTIDRGLNNYSYSALDVYGLLNITGTSEDTLLIRADYMCINAEKLMISGCNIDTKTTGNSNSLAICVSTNIDIVNGAVVIAETTNTYGAFSHSITSNSGILTIDSSTLTAIASPTNGDSVGLHLRKDVVLKNAVVSASGGTIDAWCENIIYDEASTINLNKVYVGIKTLIWDEATRTFVCPGHTGEELTCVGYLCENCYEYYGEGDGESHFGGTATCVDLKVCEGCGTSYGEYSDENHNWEGSICVDCEAVCDHGEDAELGYCYTCKTFFGLEIKPGATYDVLRETVYKFVPKVTNTLVLRTESETDPVIYLYDETFKTICSAYDSNYRENDYDPRMEYNFEAGKTYYIKIRDYNREYNFPLIFECNDHVAEIADCQHASICQSCDKELAPMDENNHTSYLVQVGSQEATYENIGWNAYEYCSKCEYTTYEEISVKVMSVVQNLVAKATDYKTATLTWNAVAGASGYDIYRQSYTEGAQFEFVQSVDTNTASITGLKTGKTYAFYVVAKNNKFSTAASEAVRVATALEGKVKLEMEQVSASKFKLSWNKIDGATRYIVYRKRNDDKLKKVLTLGADKLEYTTAEMPNGEYQFVLKAGRYDSIDRVMTKASNTVTGSVAKVKPSITLSAGTKQVKVSWKKLEGVTNYEVYRATSGKYTKIKTTTATSYTAKSLTSGKKYYFKVRGYKLYKSGDDIKYNVYTDYSSAKGATAK